MQWPRTLRLPNVFSRILPKRRPHVFAVLFFAILVTVGLSVWIQPTQAILVEIANGMIQFVSWIILALSSLFIKITIFFLELFILIAGYNNYINAPVVLLGWNMVRDVANMFFVVVLLVIAFGTILGLEQYEWRKSLAKLVFAAVFVNFSNLICQVMIDVAQVFTTTFLNAIVGTAGGNLINMFNFQEIYKISTGQDYQNFATPDSLMLDVFIAAVIALVFAGTAMWTIGAYLIVMIARMVVLWTLIILSPLGFILSVLPQTKSYADEFWSQFTHHVVVAPVMVFFLWLSFATFGGGNVVENAIEGPDNNSTNKTISNTVDQEGNPVSAGLSQAATYDRMANFVIAVAFLWIGIEQVQKLGVRAGGMTQGAMDFGKKVATIASGYAAGRYIAGKTKDAAWSGIKKGAYYAPLIGGEKWVNSAKILGGNVKGWYYGKGNEMTKAGVDLSKQLEDLHRQKADLTVEGKTSLVNNIEDKNKEIELLQKIADNADGTTTPEQQKEAQESIEAAKKEREGLQTRLIEASREPEAKAKAIDEQIKEKQTTMAKEMGGGPIGWIVRSGVALEKQAGKVEKQAENRKKLLFKQTSSEGTYGLLSPISKRIGMGSQGIGFGDKYGKGNKGGAFRFFGDVHAGIDAQDRIEEGWLQAEEARAKAKDFDKQTQGRLARLTMPRLKAKGGNFSAEAHWGNVLDQIENHKALGDGYENEIKLKEVAAKERMIEKSMRIINNDPAIARIKGNIDNLSRQIRGLGRFTEALKSMELNQKAMKLSENALTESMDELRRVEENADSTQEQKDGARKKVEDAKKKRYDDATNFEEAVAHLEKVKSAENVQIQVDPKNVGAALAEAQKKSQEMTNNLHHAQHDQAGAIEKAILARAKNKEGKNEIPAWNTARLHAEAHHAELFLEGKHKNLSDEAAQQHIWNKEGIATPSTALLDTAETLAKDFKDMDRERTVAAVKSFMSHIGEKKKHNPNYKATFEEMAMSNALLNKMEEGKWIDDAVPVLRNLVVNDMGSESYEVQRIMTSRRERSAASRTAGSSTSSQSLSTIQMTSLKEILKDALPNANELLGAIVRGTTGAEADLVKAIQMSETKANLGKLNSQKRSELGLPVGDTELPKAIEDLVRSLKRDDLRKLID